MSITWNGVSSDTIGVIVERIPNRYIPTRRFSPQQVAGRNGNVLLVDKAFPNVEQEYEVYLSAESSGLPIVARACAEWLMAPTGYATLSDSYEPNITRQAFVMGGFDLENILNKFGRCTITFSCKPQKFLSSGTVPVVLSGGGSVTNPTPFEARPLVNVTGEGEVVINGSTIQILESVTNFKIDCETMEADDNSKIYCMDFPELSGGANTITCSSTITSLIVTPRWWTL